MEKHISARVEKVSGFKTSEQENRMVEAMAFENNEADNSRWDNRIEEYANKSREQIRQMEQEISQHVYKRQERNNVTALKELVATATSTKCIEQGQRQIQSLQHMYGSQTALLTGIATTPVTYTVDEYCGRQYGRHRAMQIDGSKPKSVQWLGKQVREAA